MIKDINSYCPYCNERLSVTNKPIGVFDKCGHLIHKTNFCYRPYCLICKEDRNNALITNELSSDSQSWINVLSIKRNNINFTFKDKLRGLWRLIKIIPVLFSLYFRLYFNLLDLDYICWFNGYLIKLLNIDVTCSDLSKKRLLDSSYKRILISNHTNYHDTLVIGSLLSPTNKFGFIASKIIKTNLFGKAIIKIMPNIIIDNDIMKNESTSKNESNSENESNYNKIAEYFNKYPDETRLMIFPEGMLTHSKTVCKFRSTAFKLGYPVQPVILKYKQDIFDLIDFGIFCYPKIEVDVEVLESTNTDGSKESIEEIRNKMAKSGNFFLSNVINKKI